jgi:hypothetical protein
MHVPSLHWLWHHCVCVQATITNASGDTLKTVDFRGEPQQLCSAVCKQERPGSAKPKVWDWASVPRKQCHCQLFKEALLSLLQGVTNSLFAHACCRGQMPPKCSIANPSVAVLSVQDTAFSLITSKRALYIFQVRCYMRCVSPSCPRYKQPARVPGSTDCMLQCSAVPKARNQGTITPETRLVLKPHALW